MSSTGSYKTGVERWHAHTSGGRTRGVVNLAKPGTEGTVAYTFTAASAAPTLGQATSATEAAGAIEAGYKNFGQNKNLHILIKNNNTGANAVFKIYVYHSFAKEWAVLQGIDPTDGSHHDITLTVANNEDEYFIVPIEGVERVAIRCTSHNESNNATVYLGVNTI